MRRFYVFWFLVCAVWGYLLFELSAEEPKYSLLQTLAVLPFSALCWFALLGIELWRLGPNKKVPAPSISLRPWNMPIGTAQFIFISFTFISAWAIAFVLVRQTGFIQQPLQYLAMSLGGLIAIRGVQIGRAHV
jgi:hypothetical protein